MKMYYVLNCMEGALHWFMKLHQKSSCLSWEQFRAELLQHFGEDNCKSFKNIVDDYKNGSMMEFDDGFVSKAA